MDIFNKADARKLLTASEFPSVSLYMPTHKKTPERRQNQIRFKNLVNKATDMLNRLKVDSVKDLLSPARHLQQDNMFWSAQADGLALFCSPDLFLYYRLPVSFKEQVVVSRHFHIKPVLPLIDINGIFYVMALSQGSVKVLRCMRQECADFTPRDMPGGIRETLRYDAPQSQLQYHTGASGGSGKRPAMFHGQGLGIDEKKENLRRYCTDINRALRHLPNRDNTPLILMGIDPLLPIFRSMSDYPCLLEQEINLNPDQLNDGELHNAGWKIAESYFKDLQKQSVHQYLEYSSTGKTSCDLREIVPASHYGRVESLLVNTDVQQWGVFGPHMETPEMHDRQEAGDQDLTDTAAFNTLSHGGIVHPMSRDIIPEGSSLCAVFRY